MYVDEMYSNALVRFLVLRKALVNSSKRCSVSLSVGGGEMGWHGGGVATLWRASRTGVGWVSGTTAAIACAMKRKTGRVERMLKM
jgi:hypothetical protein